MHVLFITEKYDNPTKGVKANSFNTLIATFKETYKNNPAYSYKHLEIFEPILDETGIMSAKHLNEVLLSENFDAAIVSMNRDVTVSIDVAQKLGKKLFLIFWDTHMSAITSNRDVNFRMFIKSKPVSHVVYQHSIYEYSQFSNCLIADYGHGKILKNMYGFSAPQLETATKPLEVEKIYDVSFVGSAYTHERQKFIKAIRNSGIDVHIFGGRGNDDEYLSVQDYAKKINQTKINLNFNHSNIQPHRKGRAYEIAACKGFMLSTHPEVYKTKNLIQFRDGKDFISINLHDVCNKIKYYLDNEFERNKIAESIYERYNEYFKCEKTWNYILSLVEDK